MTTLNTGTGSDTSEYQPHASDLYKLIGAEATAIRMGEIAFDERPDKDEVEFVNTAIGNVKLPMHPAMQRRMREWFVRNSLYRASSFVFDQLADKTKIGKSELAGVIRELVADTVTNDPIERGQLGYVKNKGTPEAIRAAEKMLQASGCDTEGLHIQIVKGASQSMEAAICATCGEVDGVHRPLVCLQPAYTNYEGVCKTHKIDLVSIDRELDAEGKFVSSDIVGKIEQLFLSDNKPGAIIVTPYDNPTGCFYNQETLIEIAKLCVKYGVYMISDEAYRGLHYTEDEPSSIFRITEEDVPGISKWAIGLDSASKVLNACGLRIGTLATRNKELYDKILKASSIFLCAGTLDQYVFGGLADESVEDIQDWLDGLRKHYQKMMTQFTADMNAMLPGVIVSSPDAAIYSVVDVRDLLEDGDDFDAKEFMLFCAGQGKVEKDNGEGNKGFLGSLTERIRGRKGKKYATLGTCPMNGSYGSKSGRSSKGVEEVSVESLARDRIIDVIDDDPGRTQLRIAHVLSPEQMALVPELFAKLFEQYREWKRGGGAVAAAA